MNKKSITIDCKEYVDYSIDQRQYITKKLILRYMHFILNDIKNNQMEELEIEIDMDKGGNILELETKVYISNKDDFYTNMKILEDSLEEDFNQKDFVWGFKEDTDKIVYRIKIEY